MTKRLLAMMMVLVMGLVLAACGKDASTSVSVPLVMPPPSSSSSPRSSAPESVPEPVPEPVQNNQAFLTGLERGEDYPQDKRITAVMVNNIAASRPTRGLSEAKIVVEIKVEGGITRFMALYEDYTKLPMVGSLRSARDQFFQLLLPFWGFYIHDGPNEESHPMNLMLQEYSYGEFDLQPSKEVAYRIDRPGYDRIEYTEYTDAKYATQAIENNTADDYRSYGSPIFNFTTEADGPREPEGGGAKQVAVIHSATYRTLFDYDEGSAKYKMSMFNEINGKMEPALDENNDETLGFDNLIVLFAPMALYDDSDLEKVDYSVGGGGYYFSKGHFEPMYWDKGAPNEPLMLSPFHARRQENLKVNPGTTYIAVVDDSLLRDFNAVLLSGAAEEAAREGEMNPNREEIID